MSHAMYNCPCDYANRTGKDPRNLKSKGLADTVLYHTVLICDDAGEEVWLRPCQKDCKPPKKGELPKYEYR